MIRKWWRSKMDQIEKAKLKVIADKKEAVLTQIGILTELERKYNRDYMPDAAIYTGYQLIECHDQLKALDEMEKVEIPELDKIDEKYEVI